MTERSTQHATFVIERTYDASPARVFAAWATPEAKTQWFGAPDDWENTHELDFRVGGREYNRAWSADGPAYTYEATYHEIVPNERIAYSYTMDMNDTRISVSVSTVELKPAAKGTRLIYTEQGVFFDGHDNPAERQEGTEKLFDSLEAALRETVAQP